MANKLTDSQLVILNAASSRDDNLLLPLPRSLKLNAGAASTVLKSLLKRGLATERPAARGETAWREDDDGGAFTLEITAAGLDALGIEPGSATRPAKHETGAKPSRPAARKKAAPGRAVRKTKKSELVRLLGTGDGATIETLSRKLGWLPHTTRAALTRLRQDGMTLERIPSEKGGGARYRLADTSKTATAT